MNNIKAEASDLLYSKYICIQFLLTLITKKKYFFLLSPLIVKTANHQITFICFMQKVYKGFAISNKYSYCLISNQ